MKSAEQVADNITLDFNQAKAKHLLFKSKLRSILYGAEVEEAPILSHYECAVGKWIYGHALNDFSHVPEMHQLEKIHADIHTSARKLVELYKSGKVDVARKGLEEMEVIADQLIELLTTVESKVQITAPQTSLQGVYPQTLEVNLSELNELQRLNQDLDKRIREQTKEIYEAKERFELVAKATQDAVWDWNLTTNTIWWNEGFKDLFGYQEHQIEKGAESWTSRIHPDDQDRIIGGIHDAIDHGIKKWSAEYRFKKADGTYAIVFDRGYVLHNENNKPIKMVGSMSDITEHKKAEENLTATNKRLQLALDAGKLGSYELDMATEIVDCSAQCKINLGLASDHKLNLSGLLQIILPEDRQLVVESLQQAFTNNTVYNPEYRVVWPDQSIHWIYASGLVIQNPEGKPVKMAGVTVDITKQKLFEQELSNKVAERTRELAHANEELARSNVNLEEFAYAASHDMKEPIRKIHFFADLIKSRLTGRFTEEELRYFHRMETAAKRMGSLIDDLLSYSQVSIRPRLFDLVDLNQILQLVLGDLELEIEEKKALIHYNNLPKIRGHERQIQQAFQNLISNALKFHKTGVIPVINITCKEIYGRDTNLPLSHHEVDQLYYAIEIKDNGIGFAQAENERIFNVFTRLHGNKEYAGTGVGLSIVRKVAENHQGFVTARSILGEGSIFQILFPENIQDKH